MPKENKVILHVQTTRGKWMYVHSETSLTTNKANARRFESIVEAIEHVNKWPDWFATNTLDHQIVDV